MIGPLEFAFDRNELNGVALGSPIERLSFLGPADEDAFVAGAYIHRYRSLGLELREANGCLAEIAFVWVDRFGFGFEPFPGTCRRGSSALRLGVATREPELLALLGDPGDRSSDRDETLLRYFGPGACWEVRLGPQGTLQEIRVSEVPVEPNAPWPVGCAAVALMTLLVWVGFQDGCPGYHARSARSRMRSGHVWTEAFLEAEAVVGKGYLLRASCATRQGTPLMFARLPGKQKPRYTITDHEGSVSYPDRSAWAEAIQDALRPRPCESLKIGIDRQDAFVTALDPQGRIGSVSTVE